MNATRGGTRLRRWALIAGACLMLGSAATIAIAWWFARWPKPYPLAAAAHWSHQESSAWLYQQRRTTRAMQLNGTSASRWAASGGGALVQAPPSWSRMAEPPDLGQSPTTLIEEAFGWPWPALSQAHLPARGGRLTTLDAIQLQTQHPHEPRFLALPVRPIWRGFLGDTVVFSALAWPLIMLIVLALRFVWVARERRRHRHGKCPKCGYELRPSNGQACPECGWNRPAEMPN